MKVFDVEQRSPEWLELKRGKVSGTRLKEMFSSTWLSLIDELIAEIYGTGTPKEFHINEEMQRGIDYEPIAKQAYQQATFTTEIYEAGFCVSDKYDWLGLSPDGFIGFNGAIEIKCPNTKTHVKYIRQNKIPSEYFYQVLCYFTVNEDLQWLDFVSYDDRFPEKEIWIKRVTRIELQDDLDKVELKLSTFWETLNSKFNEIRTLRNH